MKRPLAVFGLCFFIFQIAGAFLKTQTIFYVAVFLICLYLLSAALKFRFKKLVGIGVLACFCALFSALLHAEYRIKPLEELHGQTANFTAEVYEITGGFNADSLNVHLIVKDVSGENIALKSNFSAKAMLPGVDVGDVLTFNGVFSRIEDTEKQYNYTKGKFIEIVDITSIEYKGKSGDVWYYAHLAQGYLSQNIRKHVSGNLAAVISTMSVGDSSFMAEDVRQNFNEAGLAHILVVSGMHIGIVASVMFMLAKTFLRSRAAAAVAIMASFCFAFITGLTSSCTRALIIIVLFYGAKILCRKSDVFISLAVAAVLMSAQNPFASVDLGTLLSFSATFGVILASSYLKTSQTQKRLLLSDKEVETEKDGHSILLYAQNILLIPIAATIATMPVLISFGLGISVFSVFANVISAPIVPFVTIGGMVLAAFGNIVFLKPIAMLFGFVAVGCARFINAVAQALASLPYATVHISGLPAMVCIVGAILLCVLGYRAKFRHSTIFAGSALFILLCGGFYYTVDRNVVRIVRAGSASDTAIVIMSGLETAVVFAGRSTNTEHVRDVLESYNRESAGVVIDLRKTHDAEFLVQELGAEKVILADELTNSITTDIFNDVYIDVNHQAAGNCAIVNVSDVSVCIAHGDVDMAAYEDFEIFVAGTGEAKNLMATKVWLPENASSWILDYKKAVDYYEGYKMLLLSTESDTVKWGAVNIDYE